MSLVGKARPQDICRKSQSSPPNDRNVSTRIKILRSILLMPTEVAFVSVKPYAWVLFTSFSRKSRRAIRISHIKAVGNALLARWSNEEDTADPPNMIACNATSDAELSTKSDIMEGTLREIESASRLLKHWIVSNSPSSHYDIFLFDQPWRMFCSAFTLLEYLRKQPSRYVAMSVRVGILKKDQANLHLRSIFSSGLL